MRKAIIALLAGLAVAHQAHAQQSSEIRRAQALVREAEARAYGKEIQLAEVKLEILELKLASPEARQLEIKIDRVRTDLIGATRDLNAMSPELAQLLAAREAIRNNGMTAELAEATVRLQVLRDLALTDELERARQQLERLAPRATSPDLPQTPELQESRRKRDALIQAATDSNPDAARAKTHVQEIKARVQ